jgi:hypothetical protein
MSSPSKDTLIQTLRGLLGEAFSMREAGARQGELGRSLGYADGYMRVLLDTGMLSRPELLSVVAQERARHLGPATRTLGSEETLAA